jgi:hypothetical protein
MGNSKGRDGIGGGKHMARDGQEGRRKLVAPLRRRQWCVMTGEEEKICGRGMDMMSDEVSRSKQKNQVWPHNRWETRDVGLIRAFNVNTTVEKGVIENFNNYIAVQVEIEKMSFSLGGEPLKSMFFSASV